MQINYRAKISDQWFVSMKEMAKPAIEAVKNGDTRFIPQKFEKHILIGLTTFKIGVFHVKYGGDIKYQHITVMNVDI